MGQASELLAVLLLLGCAATALWVHRIHIDEPGGHGEMLQADTFRYFHPNVVFLHRELRQGRLPLWNPYQLAGQPYLALHVPAVLYPPNLVFAAIFSPVLAIEANAVFHLALAGFFAWLLARRVGLGPAARYAAAAGYMFSAPLFLGFYMPPFLATPVWFPAILWAVQGLIDEKRPRWAIALAVFLALAFLGGHTQAFVYQVQVALLFGIVGAAFVAGKGGLLRVIGLAAVSGCLALGFIAPQLLPTVELVGEAVRGFDGVSYEQAAHSYVSPEALLAGILRPFGPALESPAPGLLRWLVVLPVFALPLIVFGWLERSLRPQVATFTLLAAVVGVLLLGYRGALYEVYFSLPFGNLFRNAGRWAFVYALLTSLLVAMGIEALSRSLVRAPRARPVAGVVAYALALLVAADFYARSGLDHAHPAAASVTAGADPGLIDYIGSRPDRGRVFVQNFGFYHLGSLYKVGMMNGIFAVPDYEPSMPASYREYFGVPATPPWHGQLHVAPLAGGQRSRYQIDPAKLDLMSVRYYAIRDPAPPRVRNGMRELADGPGRSFEEMEVFQRRRALPRVYAVRRVARAPDLASALGTLEAASFRPHREAVVVDPSGPATAATGRAAAEGEDRASIAAYDPDEVTIVVDCSAACLLVLTDLYYPGWRVHVDGEERPIERVNGIFRGVQLEAGDHRVVYRFAPRSFYAGVGVFFVAALAAGLIWRRG